MPNERKQQIIKAAAKRFARHGLSKTTLDEVARDIRIGKATIYHYFISKDELYFETLRWECGNFIAQIKQIFENESLPLKQKLNDYYQSKEVISDQNKMIFEALLSYFNGKSFEKELETIRWMIDQESEILKHFLTKHYAQQIKKLSTMFPNFIVLNSWGMFFANRLASLNENPQSEEIKKLFIDSLELILS